MDNQSSPAISLGEWIITLIVLAIPLVNIIMLFVWGFSGSTNPTKRNYCRAVLIFLVVGIILAFLFGGLGMIAAMHSASAERRLFPVRRCPRRRIGTLQLPRRPGRLRAPDSLFRIVVEIRCEPALGFGAWSSPCARHSPRPAPLQAGRPRNTGCPDAQNTSRTRRRPDTSNSLRSVRCRHSPSRSAARTALAFSV